MNDGKILLMHLHPGDLIEWTYKWDGNIVAEDETLWSTPMSRWVPIGSGLVHTLISIDDEQMCWLNEEGLFYARVYDAGTHHEFLPRRKVASRACV